MFNQTVDYFETPEQKTRIVAALNCVCAARPYLSGLASLLKIFVTNSVETAGITATGRLLINPQFLDRQSLQDMVFVLAHELMHLVLQTHERKGNYTNHKLVNIAHDFIINDDLMEDFSSCTSYCDGERRPPAGGLHWPDYKNRISDWKPASEYSLEELVSLLRRQNIYPSQTWDSGRVTSTNSGQPLSGGGGGGSLGNLLEEIGISAPKDSSQSDPNSQEDPNSQSNSNSQSDPKSNTANSSDARQKSRHSSPPSKNRIKSRLDVISDEDEQKAFPDLTPLDAISEKKEVQQVAIRSYSEAVLSHNMETNDQSWRGMGGEAGSYYKNYSRLQDAYHVPWEMALQRWFDSVAPGDRSFARASRRGAWRTDVVLPGRKREGWTLNIVLDTSGSMIDILPKALGAIAQFCESNNVEKVRVIQIDTIIHQDEIIDVQSLENVKILGLGGNDMQPAWDRLMEDPEIEAVVVVSDGGFDVPPEPPFEVLWAITDTYYKNWFKPSYGTIVYIENNNY